MGTLVPIFRLNYILTLTLYILVGNTMSSQLATCPTAVISSTIHLCTCQRHGCARDVVIRHAPTILAWISSQAIYLQKTSNEWNIQTSEIVRSKQFGSNRTLPACKGGFLTSNANSCSLFVFNYVDCLFPPATQPLLFSLLFIFCIVTNNYCRLKMAVGNLQK